MAFLPLPSDMELLAGGALIICLALLAIKSKAIDVSGALSGALISFTVFLAGGLSWLLVIVAFFTISSLLTRFRYDYKKRLGSAQEKGGVRSWPNTLANALIAGLAAVAEIVTHQDLFVVAFLGSIAAAMSDTVATEVGLLSKSKPRLIVNLRKFVEPGTSGGVSILGELAGLASILGIALIGVSLSIVTGDSAVVSVAVLSIVFGALIATNFDSLLGGTLQGQNKCQVCGARTENLLHHEKSTVLVKGVRYLDNNVVNLIATLTGALVSIGLYLVLLRIIA
jgi:uncharacterized protein (TIGR00297 family)